MVVNNNEIERFDFEDGEELAGKYVVSGFLGAGYEGEVYMLHEIATGIDRAGKFYFPQRNLKKKSSTFLAKKLHKLRDCPVLIRYLTQEEIWIDDHNLTCLISDFVEGEQLVEFIKRQRGGRLSPFEGIHLLHALAKGLEPVHRAGEYHGDLHCENVLVRRHGLGFEVKVLDLYHWGRPSSAEIFDDVCDLIRIFYDAVGGRKRYAKQPPEVKAICCGLKRSLIRKKFKTAGQLREYLENMAWED